MKIDRIETVVLDERAGLRALLVVRIHAEGLVGHGDTYYVPEAVAAYIHDFAAELLLGQDAREINAHWQRAYEACARFGLGGAEIRGISAIDLALHDLVAQGLGVPVYQLLGGRVRERVPTYNTCAGAQYGSTVRPARGSAAAEGLDGPEAVRERPVEVAESIRADGFAGMKIWPFDEFAIARGSGRIAPADLDAGVRIFEAIRSQVGSDLDVMLEGHGYWSLPAAREIARALEPYGLRWAEDLMLASAPEAVADLRRSTATPLAVSEYLVTRWGYKPFLDGAACDYVMIDPSWCGGIGESQRICALAETYGLPATIHDATGPFTYLAGLHIAASTPNVLFQETVRTFLRDVYTRFSDIEVEIADGTAAVPTGPGLGARLLDEALAWPGSIVRASGARLA